MAARDSFLIGISLCCVDLLQQAPRSKFGSAGFLPGLLWEGCGKIGQKVTLRCRQEKNGEKMDIPKNFDWVKARSKCSLEEVFVNLGEVVDSDVKTTNSLSHKTGEFAINRPNGKIVVVKTQQTSAKKSIVFELTNQGVCVKEGLGGKHLFLGKPSLIPSGDCKLQVDGEQEPLELWQFSRRALEDLFFG
jgi:hypothetical protein